MAYTHNIANGRVIRDSDQYQVAPCQSVNDPDYVAYIAWINAGNAPVVVDIAPPTFEPVTRAQLRLALDAAGLTAGVEAAIAAGPAALRITWEDSQAFVIRVLYRRRVAEDAETAQRELIALLAEQAEDRAIADSLGV